MYSQEEWKEWYSSPLTKEFVSVIKSTRDNYKENVIDSVLSNNYHGGAVHAGYVLCLDGFDGLMSNLMGDSREDD